MEIRIESVNKDNSQGTPWSRIREQNSVDKGLLEIVGNGKLTGSVRKETIAVSDTISMCVQNRHSRILLQDLLRSRVWKIHRELEVLEAVAQMGAWLDCRARISFAPLHSVKKWHSPECLFYKFESGCRFGEKCSYAHRQVDEQPSKRSTKNGDKSAVASLKITRHLGCEFHDMEPPKSSSILRKSSDKRKPIRCVKFTKAVARHADIRGQIHRLE